MSDYITITSKPRRITIMGRDGIRVRVGERAITSINRNARVCILVNRSGIGDYAAFLSSLVAHDSDETAFAAGVTMGKWYKTADNTVYAMSGVPRQQNSY